MRADHLFRRQPRLVWPALVATVLATAVVVGTTRPHASFGEGSIAFSADDGLYVIEGDGSGLRRIAEDLDVFRSSWSPDGSRLLTRTEQGGLRAIGADGDDAVDLLSGTGMQVRAASWAPDGSRIVMSTVDASRPAVGSQLLSVAMDGTDLRAMEAVGPDTDRTVPIEGDDPTWSPDGGWLAYTDRASRLWIVRTDGSERRALSSAPSADEPAFGGFSWAPDSSRLTYQRVIAGVSEARSIGIFIVGVDGEDEERISTGSLVQVAPRWSPDGRRIAWFVESGDGFRIIAFDVASEQATELRTDALFQGGWLAWSPEGSWLATVTTDRERLAIIRVDRTTPDLYIAAEDHISGVAWQS